MAGKKTRYFELNTQSGGFVSKLKNKEAEKHNFSDIKVLRSLLSNEKARILYAIKNQNPESIYQLAKILKRDLKSIRQDIKMLEKYGFVELLSKKKGKRISHIPILAIDRMEFILKF